MKPYGTRADRDCGRRAWPGHHGQPRAYGAIGDAKPDGEHGNRRERTRARRLARRAIVAALAEHDRGADA